MTPVSHNSQWLPIQQRITFKTVILAYKSLHGMAPQYLQSYFELESARSGCHHLYSAQSGQLSVPQTRTKYGEHSFAIQAPVSYTHLTLPTNREV